MKKIIFNSLISLSILVSSKIYAKNMIYDYIKTVKDTDFIATYNYEEFNNRSKIKNLNLKYRFKSIDEKIKIIENEINSFFKTKKYFGIVKSLSNKSISKDNYYVKNYIIYDILKECCYDDINLVSVPHERLIERKDKYYNSRLKKWLNLNEILNMYGVKPKVMNEKEIYLNALYERIEINNMTYDKNYENQLNFIVKNSSMAYEAKFSIANRYLINGDCRNYEKYFKKYLKSVKKFKLKRKKNKCINKIKKYNKNRNIGVITETERNLNNFKIEHKNNKLSNNRVYVKEENNKTDLYLNKKIIKNINELILKKTKIDYKLGSKDINLGKLDCSGFVSFILNKSGVKIIKNNSNTVSLDYILSESNSKKVYDYKNNNNIYNLKNGDVLIFYFNRYDKKDKIPFHTGIYYKFKKSKGIIHVVSKKGLLHQRLNNFYLKNLKYGYRIKIKNDIEKIQIKNMKYITNIFCNKVTYRQKNKKYCK